MTSDAMRNRQPKAKPVEPVRQPLPPQKWVALSAWREVIGQLEPRAHRVAPIADIWLPALLHEIDQRFDQPLSVKDEGQVRTITALGFLRYTIDRKARTVGSTLLAGKGAIEVDPSKFDVVCAWRRFGWLDRLLGELSAVRVAETVLPEPLRPRFRTWIAKTLAPMLRRDERFQRLRAALRQALWFDPSLIRLALRTRGLLGPDGLLGDRLMMVWQHAEHLREVEKHAPRLLPLAFTLTDKLIQQPASEAMKTLKGLLAPIGMTDVGWRYLLRHDLRAISETGGGRLTVEQVTRMAQALALAGGHPPPPPALREAWRARFPAIREHGPEHRHGMLTWLATQPRLARAILKATSQIKRTPEYPQFIDDVTAVLWWVHDAKITAPRKALPTLIRMARTWEADQLAIARTGLRRWSRPRSVPCADSVHEAVLLDGPVAVLEEAQAMRNCLRTRMRVLRARKVQVWSVRHKETGARVALVELKRDGERWKPGQIAARFNRPAPAWVTNFGETLAVCESLRNEPTGAAE